LRVYFRVANILLFFLAEDGIRDRIVTGVQTCALPISGNRINLEVDFFGGEPLMNWDVVKRLVEYGRSQEKIHNKKFRFTLTTNGVLLNDEVMEFCNKEMSNVVLSLDGRKEVNDKMRPFRNGK